MMKPRSRQLNAEQQRRLAHELPLHEQLWGLCDGHRDVSQLADALSLTTAQVWSMLDELADLHALHERVAPPITQIPMLVGASMSRRQALARIGVGALGAGVAMRTLGSSLAYAQDDLAQPAQTAQPAQPSREVTFDDGGAELDAAKKRLQERDAKAAEAKKQVQEAATKRQESDRCQEAHKKSGARQPPTNCADSKVVREAERKSQQQLKKAGQEERDAKRQVTQAQKRHLEAKKKHTSESHTKGKKHHQEAEMKRKASDRVKESAAKR